MGIANAWRELWKPNPQKLARRSYAAATVNRLTSNWVTSNSSADNEILSSARKVRSRARQLSRDSDYCKNALRGITDNVVGTGVRLQSQVRKRGPRGNNKLDQKVNDQIETAWKKWGKKDSCHTAGKLSFDDITRTAVAAMALDGECFIRIIRGQKFGKSDIPIALEVLEADMVDEDYVGKSANKGWQWRMGIEVDTWQRPRNYGFLTRHPGDTLFPIGVVDDKRHIIVPAKDVIHLFKVERPGQTRGVSWFASAIERLHHLSGFEQAELVRARASSCLMAWISSPESEVSADGIEDQERVYDMEPGAVRVLANGESVHVPNLDAPDGQFEPFVRAMLRALAAGIGCSYESISRDYSQSNYSSSRLSLLQDQEAFKALQHQLQENLLSIIYDQWLEIAVLSGALNLPGYQQDSDHYHKTRWLFRGWGWVDPMKEVQAYKEAVRCGFKTQAQVIAESGGDLEELLTARKSEIELAESLGLKFDTEPETVTDTQTSTKVSETNPKVDDGEQT